MAYRIAKSLDVLRNQVNLNYPSRSKVSDGWIGDTAHAARASDHNPDVNGVVKALDITHDPAHGVDTWKMAETLRLHKDPRISYVISNGRIFSSTVSPWQWRTYTGSNAHAHHMHVSVKGDAANYDSASPWKLDDVMNVPTTQPVAAPKPKGIDDSMRRRMMATIIKYEGKDPPEVFIAPDGNPEIAGITQKDHAAVYASLKHLLDTGQTDRLRNAVFDYYDAYTDPAQNWTDKAGLEFFLRDCILNRGPTGAAEILQMAVTPNDIDHQVGPTTRGALAALTFDEALLKLRDSRERYENKKYGKAFREARGQWKGLLNRWNKAEADARLFQKEQESGVLGKTEGQTGGGVLIGTGSAVAVAVNQGLSWPEIAAIAFIGICVAALAYKVVQHYRTRA